MPRAIAVNDTVRYTSEYLTRLGLPGKSRVHTYGRVKTVSQGIYTLGDVADVVWSTGITTRLHVCNLERIGA